MRQVEPGDTQFIYECMKDWPPHPRKGIVTLDKVDMWVRRWINRSDEKARIWPGIGIMHYRTGPYSAVIDGIAVHPYERRKGHSKRMRAELKQYLAEQGIMVATFKTLPGPMRDQYGEDGVESVWIT